jgi:hypothetical protein
MADSPNPTASSSAALPESYVDSGLLTLIDTGAEFIATISPAH